MFQGGDQGGFEDRLGQQQRNKPHVGQTNPGTRAARWAPGPFPGISVPTICIFTVVTDGESGMLKNEREIARGEESRV